MDYDQFDNDADTTTDEEYAAFVAWLCEQTANALRKVKGDAVAQKQALCRYYECGEHANLTASELIDFLCVSTPSILDAAGYNEAEADELISISGGLTDDDIST